MINIWRAGATDPASKGDHSINFSYFIQDPFTGFIRHLQCDLKAPKGTNWGHYCDPEMDKLLDAFRTAARGEPLPDSEGAARRAAEGP